MAPEHRFGSTTILGLLILLLIGSPEPVASGVGSSRSSPKPVAPKPPQQALKTIRAQPGFRIELAAAEPLVQDPIAIAFDEDGRMFVVEFPEYNHRHAGWELKAQGRVRLLEDANGDGYFEKSTVFVDRLASPTGVICCNGGVYIAAAPDILYCKDTDGDGRADVRKTIFTGFGISENRGGGGRLNSLRWGLDNRIHLCTSFSGGEVRLADEKDAPLLTVRNRGFAFDPRTHQFSATSGNGQHGLAMDDWGRFFLCNNSDPFRLLMYESHYAERNPHAAAPTPYISIAADGKFTKLHRVSDVEPWRVERTRRRVAGEYRGSAEGGTPAGFFTSATGVTVYRGDAWPQEYRGNIFVGQVSGNLVHRAKLSSNGLELVASPAEKEAEFVASTDNWFRPVELANAPDGNLYIADMYRELIETALALPPDVLKQLKPSAGVKRGRIYRIVADGSKPRPSPQLGRATTGELVALLEHRNGWHRDTAARLLYERQDQAAMAPLKKLAVESSFPQGRMTALHVLHGLKALSPPTILKALDDASHDVRFHAVRLAESLIAETTVQQKLLKMTDDSSLHVRYQLAFSLGEIDVGDNRLRNQALTKLVLANGKDKWMRFAVLTSLHEGGGEAFQTLLGHADFRTQRYGREFLIALADQIGAANQKQDVTAFAHSLEKIAEDASNRSLCRSLVRSLVEKRGPVKRKRLLAIAGTQSQQIVAELVAEAKAKAANEKLAPSKRASALRTLALGDFAEAKNVLHDLLEIRQPKAVQSAVLQTLARFEDRHVANLPIEAWPNFSPDLRVQATETLLLRRDWLNAFLDAVEAGTVARSDVDPARVQLLKKHPDERIRRRIEQLFQATPPRRAEVVGAYQKALQLTGDPARGKQVFKKVCSACHKLEGVGTAVGAELAAMKDRSPSALLLNILDPNREVKPKFLNYVVQTEDGRVLTGMITAESANGLTLRQSDGRTVSVQRTEIEDLQSTGLSFMPEGLEKDVDVQAMADLLMYLGKKSYILNKSESEIAND